MITTLVLVMNALNSHFFYIINYSFSTHYLGRDSFFSSFNLVCVCVCVLLTCLFDFVLMMLASELLFITAFVLTDDGPYCCG